MTALSILLETQEEILVFFMNLSSRILARNENANLATRLSSTKSHNNSEKPYDVEMSVINHFFRKSFMIGSGVNKLVIQKNSMERTKQALCIFLV